MKRNYIRHPTAIPLQFELGIGKHTCAAKDVNEGGLCFVCNKPVKVNQDIKITIQSCEPQFSANGVVKWCSKDGNHFLVGVAFEDDAVKYAVRMVEQVCHIENYRKQLQRETGIALTSEEAAMEWIKKYAANFPSIQH